MYKLARSWNGTVDDAGESINSHGLCGPNNFKSLMDVIRGKKIETVFQPIVDLHKGEVFAYEALSRIIGKSSFSNTEELFKASQFFRRTTQLESICHKIALESAGKLHLDRPISINLCPSVFKSPDEAQDSRQDLMEGLYEVRDRIIVELTERFCIQDDELFKRTTAHYQEMGFRIAIDDLGSGYAGLKMLAQIEPFMVKLDRFLIAGIDRSTKKQMLISSFVSFCHKINAIVVAEGIETKEELETVASMKVDLGQGYYLARPSKMAEECNEKVKQEILEINRPSITGIEVDNFIGSLAKYVTPVSPDYEVDALLKRFDAEKNLYSVPVVRDNRPVGILHKAKIFHKLGRRYGYDLFAKKSVESILEKGMVFEASTTLDTVAAAVLARKTAEIYDALIVVINGAYLGIVQIHALLEAIARQKVNMAKQANPLTGLPGNNLIKEQIGDRLGAKQIFAVMYFDLDNFKPFNDNFGFEKGDQVIRLVGNILKDMTPEWDPLGFVGHIGGDDFVVICRAAGIESFCQAVLERFQAETMRFYPDDVLEAGCYQSRDRRGRERTFPLLSLSIAILTTQQRTINSFGHLASLASEVKKKAKSIQGNSYYVDRRRE